MIKIILKTNEKIRQKADKKKRKKKLKWYNMNIFLKDPTLHTHIYIYIYI